VAGKGRRETSPPLPSSLEADLHSPSKVDQCRII
jgi:hypothetical protein